jgi:uncharacterized protein (TIGR03084 family)
MDEILEALAEQHAELYRLVADLDEAQWQRPSRCEGWSVADVVLHLSQTDELAIGSASGQFSEALGTLAHGIGPAGNVDDGADLMVARDRGQPGSAVLQRWKTGADHLRALLGATDPHARVVWVAGELSARTLATTRLAECWIHTGDVAEAIGVELVPGDRLRHIARLAWRTLPYAFARSGRELSGPVAFELVGPNGDTWRFAPDDTPLTTVSGPAVDLCLVAARRVEPTATALVADGPDAEAVLELVRTYA